MPDIFEPANPILRVQELDRSVEYFRAKLGFELRWSHRDLFACVARGHCSIFLSVGDQGHFGSWVWIGVPDVERLHREFVANGASIRNPPTNYSWAYEMQVADPDGNVLRFGSDPIPDEPLGEFLDMEGKRWPTE